MADVDLIATLIGPAGALAATATAAAVLWRRHVKDDDLREAVHTRDIALVAAAHERELVRERERTAEAERRLDALGATMTKATDVMERSVAITEKAVEATAIVVDDARARARTNADARG